MTLKDLADRAEKSDLSVGSNLVAYYEIVRQLEAEDFDNLLTFRLYYGKIYNR